MAVSDLAIGDALAPTAGLFGSTFAKIMSYAWVLFPIGIIIFVVGAIWVYKAWKKKKTQWTHTLIVKRVGQDKKIMPEFSTHKMRRFPIIKEAEVFELEIPLLGCYLIPELEEYSGRNQYSIIIDKNNRIYTNKGEYFDKEKSSINVSGKHSEIDIAMAQLKADFQNINEVNKRVEWATIAKYIAVTLFMVLAFILALKGISAWGEAQEQKAIEQQAEAIAFQNLASAMEVMASTVNTQRLEILPLMKEIYKTENIQGIINTPVVINGTI